MDIAQFQRIAPALWAALRSRGLIEYLPFEVRNDLFKLHLRNALRNRGLRDQAIEAIRQINSIGVEPLLLKGSVSLLVETFDDPGARFMADLDILVPRSAAEACWNALCALGYLPVEDNPHYHIDYANCHHHLRPLYRPGSFGTIEIHRDALPDSAARILPTLMIWDESEPVGNSLNLRIRIPSATHRVLHNLLHSDLINQTYVRGRVSLRSLHEVAVMQTICREELDWETIRQMVDRSGHGRILRATLYLADRLFGSPMPDGIRGTFGSVIHYARSRLQVRWSWLDELVERLFWFSTPSICERYRCDDRFLSVTKGRVRLAWHLACRSGGRLLCVGGQQIS
jgi:hypothetical protein